MDSPPQAYNVARILIDGRRVRLLLEAEEDVSQALRGPIEFSIRGAMLVHCVNPACYMPLRSFSEGRLFQFEVVSISIAASDDTAAPFDEKPEHQTAHFWLCGRCADKMTLVLEPVNGLRVIPLGLGGAEVSNLADISLAECEMPQTDSC